ncbi:MAG TPA: AMIN domain-containing protein [Burkholderiales bacterium]|nr:AMIN domain-containing protein [Burkholderiales bacterium]
MSPARIGSALAALGAGLAACAACLAFAAATSAPNTIESLEHAVFPGGKVIVKLVFRQELDARPPVLVSHHPALHVALDFADTASALASQTMEVGQRGVRMVEVVRAGARTRVIIHLTAPLVHELELRGRELWITLTRPGPSSGAAGALREIAFESAGPGAARIVVELAGGPTPVALRQQGNTLLVDFAGAILPARLERRLDVQDFGTPVRAIETYRAGGGTRLRIEFASAAEFTAYQVNGRLVLSSPH